MLYVNETGCVQDAIMIAAHARMVHGTMCRQVTRVKEVCLHNDEFRAVVILNAHGSLRRIFGGEDACCQQMP